MEAVFAPAGDSIACYFCVFDQKADSHIYIHPGIQDCEKSEATLGEGAENGCKACLEDTDGSADMCSFVEWQPGPCPGVSCFLNQEELALLIEAVEGGDDRVIHDLIVRNAPRVSIDTERPVLIVRTCTGVMQAEVAVPQTTVGPLRALLSAKPGSHLGLGAG
jgi:hypothetical protein